MMTNVAVEVFNPNKPRTPWKDLPQEEKKRLLRVPAKKEESWMTMTDAGKQEIEKLREAKYYVWKSSRMLCFICKKECQGESCRFTRLPYIAHASCVDEAPIYRGPAIVTSKGEIKPKRATDVEGWCRNFNSQNEKQIFSVHDVLAWIKAEAGPEFSYAGVRRMCKLLFIIAGRGTFTAPDRLVDSVSKKAQKGSKKASRVNTSLKQYTKTGRRKHGVKKKGK